MKRIFLNDDSSIKCVLEGIKELIELNTALTDNYVDDIEPSTSTDYFCNESGIFMSIGNPPSANHTFSYTSKEWFDPRTLEDIKAQKWAEIKVQRDRLEFGGFTFEGNIYDSDQVSQGRIMVATIAGVSQGRIMGATIAGVSQGRIMGATIAGVDQVWTLAGNTTVELSALQLQQLYAALQAHIASAHERGRIARQLILEAGTKEQVEAVQL